MRSNSQLKASRLKNFIRIIAMFSILIYGGYYFYVNQEEFHALTQINLKTLGIMIIFILVNIFASSSENALLYRSLGAPVSNIESLGLTNIAAFFNLLFPQGGTITKAVYLKQKYKIPYSKTPAMFLGLLVIYLLIGSLMLLSTNIATLLIGGEVPLIFWIASCGACASGFLFMFDFPKNLFPKLGKFNILISNYSDGWKSLRTDKHRLMKACIWQFIIFISSGIWVSSAYYSLGIKINPLLGISLSIFISFTNILVLIPGNFGIQEAVYGYFTFLTGMPFAQGVVVSTLVRVVLLAITLIMAPFSWYFLLYRQNINISKQNFARKLDKYPE